jgi:hypothetical protein
MSACVAASVTHPRASRGHQTPRMSLLAFRNVMIMAGRALFPKARSEGRGRLLHRATIQGKADCMKPTADEVVKAFKGLAIAAARARELATDNGKEGLLDDLPRRQKDAVRQHLLEIKTDVETVLRIMTQRNKT